MFARKENGRNNYYSEENFIQIDHYYHTIILYTLSIIFT